MNAILPYLRWMMGESSVCGIVGAYTPPVGGDQLLNEDGAALTDEDGTPLENES